MKLCMTLFFHLSNLRVDYKYSIRVDSAVKEKRVSEDPLVALIQENPQLIQLKYFMDLARKNPPTKEREGPPSASSLPHPRLRRAQLLLYAASSHSLTLSAPRATASSFAQPAGSPPSSSRPHGRCSASSSLLVSGWASPSSPAWLRWTLAGSSPSSPSPHARFCFSLATGCSLAGAHRAGLAPHSREEHRRAHHRAAQQARKERRRGMGRSTPQIGEERRRRLDQAPCCTDQGCSIPAACSTSGHPLTELFS
ncbi:uncharacterized protein LOC119332835 [Triticum dicoccoides]|uniref:uncharacterized protein LOC119332835 n=1 Tax=Triticum dicoccoides TaxID=85692 RepID=UPI0018919144|nr:uncharacterized protein LOC119332835 [Triticum dicoccoides]